MSIRFARLLLALALVALASGAPRVVLAALDADCCEERCEGAVDGTHCPPFCDGPCATSTTWLGATVVPSVGRMPEARSVATIPMAVPDLPLVVTGVFHPPRS